MAVDYDLVILGGTALARSIAAQACRFQAQVALVEPQLPRETHHFRLLLNHWATLAHQAKRLPQFDAPSPSPITSINSHPSLTELFHTIVQTAPLLTETVMIQQQQSLDQLAAAGVDVLVGQGEFHRLPRMGFRVNGRSLRSRAYLLALPSLPAIPAISGLSEVPFLTLDNLADLADLDLADLDLADLDLADLDLADLKEKTLPERMAILGDDPQAIDLAQSFQRLGVQVALIQSQLLPRLERQAVRLIQSQLESEGVELFTGVKIDRVETANSGIQLAGSDASGSTYLIETDLLLLTTARQLDLSPLNLESIGVKWTPGGMTVNRKLQTSHPRVYACGETLGGFTQAHLARYEADLILHNVLFLPPRTAQPRSVPWMLLTDPQVAQVGMDEAAAQRTYGKKVQVISVSTRTIAKAYLEEETPGFCTLILRHDGKILGGTIVSPQATEWVSILTLAIQQNLSMSQFARLPIPSPSFAELLDRLTHTWQHQRLSSRQRTWLDRYFDFRRSWSS